MPIVVVPDRVPVHGPPINDPERRPGGCVEEFGHDPAIRLVEMLLVRHRGPPMGLEPLKEEPHVVPTRPPDWGRRLGIRWTEEVAVQKDGQRRLRGLAETA